MEEQRLNKAEEKKEEEKLIEDGEFSLFSMWDCGSPLYDSFELSSLFHIIDKHMMKLPFLLSRSSPEREGRVEMTEVTDVVAVRRLKMKKEKRSKRRRAVGLRAIFSAIISLKKFNDK
ncbi:hypothetical protein IEQ34_011038 [Dendrobium chrysotoxum]|uniref:Uncharacterized protein n=1 Tax=Dendrobium chrysotoxum TaxID=161865 RepID=A0AAV7GWC7_DENCH|nr:hypothetical protein IEQ34_011038 [Dendrobium chrysotoxum]